MNEFIAKKLGEVLAFARVGTDTWTRGRTAISSILGDNTFEEALRENDIHERSLLALHEGDEMKKVTMDKAEATAAKLKAMRDLYVKDQWDNPTELMEWSGFFEGAAIVHWKLILGLAEALTDEELMQLAGDAISFHEKILEKAKDHLQEIGQTKAK